MTPRKDCVYNVSFKQKTNARITTIFHEKYSCKLIGSIPKKADT